MESHDASRTRSPRLVPSLKPSPRKGSSSPHGRLSAKVAAVAGTASAPNTGHQPVRPVSATQAACGRLSVAEYQSATAEVLQEQVQLVHQALCARQAAFDRTRKDVERSTSKMQQLQQEIKSLQDEDAQLSSKVPLPVNRLCRVRQWLAGKVASLDAETAALEGKQMALLHAESKLRSQEIEAGLLQEAATNLNTAAVAAEEAALRGALAAHGREAAAAQRQLTHLFAERQQAQQQSIKRRQQAEEQDRLVAQLQTQAKQRLHASLVPIQADAAALADAAAARGSQHLQPLLKLKASVDEVREGVARRAEKIRQLRKQKHEQEQREFEALQEQGLNPYQVYRVRSQEAAAAKAAAALEAVQQQRRAKLAASLASEESTYRKQLARAEFDKQVEEDYQHQMGITAEQQRRDAYMRSHTLSHQVLLDPTSRVPVYASDAVLVKPAGFGLGRSSPEILAKVAAKHAGQDLDLQDSLLLPRKYRTGSCSPTQKWQQGRQAGLRADDADGGSPPSLGAAALDAPRSPAGGDDHDAAADSHDAANDDFDPEQYADDSSGSEADNETAKDTDDTGPSGAGHRKHHSPHSSRQPQQLQVAHLSKFEAERLQQAKQRHKQQVTQPKATFGRVFAGDAFIADPPAIVFKDFVPGQTYKTAVKLINRSFTGNSIRLLELPAEVMHVLELVMPPSGCLAPGVAATLRVTFKPQADEPLAASIPLLAETGPLTLPFKALVREALPAIQPCPCVSLDGRAGGVMLGASSSTAVTISNAGVLDVLYTIKVLGPLAATAEYDEAPEPPPPADASEADMAHLQAETWAAASLSVAGVQVHGVKGRVPGYGSCSFEVSFRPKVAGPVEVPVLVSFTAPDARHLEVPPVQLVLQATGRELPVSTLTPLVDFRCVMFGQKYTAPLMLANAGKSAMKVLVVAKPELSNWITFTPEFGFIQADDTLAVSVNLKPTPDMMHKLAEYLVSQEQDTFLIPLQVNVPGQPLPLPVKLRLQATTSDLHLRPRTLDFGKVPLSEAAGVQLTLTNPSLLPQSFSFGAKLPLGLKISPNAGYGRVLPKQSIKLLATFQPPIPGLQFFDVNCRTTTGRVFKVEGKCDGLTPNVTLSHNVIKFPATAVGDNSSASVVLRNSSSSATYEFEVGVPQGSYLQVTPRVGLLKPRGSIRLQLDFSPPASVCSPSPSPPSASVPPAAATTPAETGLTAGVSSTPAGGGVTAAAAAAGGQNSEGEGLGSQACSNTSSSSDGSTAWYREWLLPCFIRQTCDGSAPFDASSSSQDPSPWRAAASSGTGGAAAAVSGSSKAVEAAATTSSSGGSGAAAAEGGQDCVLHLSVVTCAIPPELHLVSPPDLPRPASKNYFVLDCGALPVGEKATRELLLENSGLDVASLVASPLDPVGPFAIVNALRPLPPSGGQARVLVAFSPPDCCEYQDMLTIRSCKSRVRVSLRGRGIAPALSVSPPNAVLAAGGLVFGDVLLSDPVMKELKVAVTNSGPFTVTWNTRFIGPSPEAPHTPAAALQPTAGVAGGGGAAAGAAAGKAAGSTTVAVSASSAGTVGAAAAASKAGAAAAGTAAANALSQQQQQQDGMSSAQVAATAAYAGQPSGCFYCKPSSGVLQAGQAQELTIVFAPMGIPGDGHASMRGPWGPLSPYVRDRLQVVVPHQQQDVVVPLQGNAWPDGVFVSGAEYRGAGSSDRLLPPAAGQAQQRLPMVGATAVVVQQQDPFAAILLAAAAANANASASSSSAAGAGVQSGKAKAGVAATATTAGPPGCAASAAPATSQQELAAAIAAAGYCSLARGFIALPGPVAPGQSSSVVVDFGAIKSSAGGAAAELLVEELPPDAREAGWSVDPVKVAVQAGERRPLTIRFSAPPASKLQGTVLGALGQLALPHEQVLRLSCTMKGGCQPLGPGAVAAAAATAAPVGPDGSRRLTLLCACVMVPDVCAGGARGGQVRQGAASPGGSAALVAAATPAAAAGKK